MNHQRLISDYILECVKNGISSNEEILANVSKELGDIDTKLSAVEPLRIKRSHLQKIKDHFDLILKSDENTFNDETDDAEQMRQQVISIIAASTTPLTNREIINKIGYNQDALIIRAIKTLFDQQVIDRTNDNERKIVRGPKWV